MKQKQIYLMLIIAFLVLAPFKAFANESDEDNEEDNTRGNNNCCTNCNLSFDKFNWWLAWYSQTPELQCRADKDITRTSTNNAIIQNNEDQNNCNLSFDKFNWWLAWYSQTPGLQCKANEDINRN